MNAAANIRVNPRGKGVDRGLVVPIPAHEVISTTLVVTDDASRLPTLSSVERIIGRIAALGLVLEDPREAAKIAHVVNKRYLPVDPDAWKDQPLSVKVARTDGEGGSEALRAVGALRLPALIAAEGVLARGGSCDPAERRYVEIRLVDDLTAAVATRKTAWQRFGVLGLEFLSKTFIGLLVDQIVGIPVTDLIRTTVRGAGRLVF